MAGNKDELCSCVGWKVGLVSDELGYLAKISKQNMEGTAGFLLAF